MANVKISDLTGAASASGTQEFEVNDSGTSKKVTGSQLATFIEGEVSSSPTLTGQVSLDNGTNTAPSLTNTGDTNTGLYFPSDDTVGLAAGGGLKLSANASGVDVTGTLTSDGLTVEVADGFGVDLTGGAGSFSEASYYWAQGQRASFGYDGSRVSISDKNANGLTGNKSLRVSLGGADRLFVNHNTGDISFYEDTGTTPKFFWDASAERLGLGTVLPSTQLDVVGGIRSTSSGGYNQITTTSIGDAVFDNNGNNWLTVKDGVPANAMRIDSSGNVGIGTSSPNTALTIINNNPYQLRLATTDNAYSSAGIFLGEDVSDPSYYGTINWDQSATSMRISMRDGSNAGGLIFETGNSSSVPTERMRIDSSGNVLVGTTDQFPADETDNAGISLRNDGRIDVSNDGGLAGIFNRMTSDGNIISFRKDGTTVGSIASHGGNGIYIGSGTSGGAAVSFYSSDPNVYPARNSGGTFVLADNQIDLGSSGWRYDDVYATNGTIQTSDRNEKQDIDVLSDAEQRVAVACKGLLRKFRWKDAVAEKGDNARIHFGIIAQDLQDAFAAEGLDAGRYAMFISSTWWETQTDVPAVEAVAAVYENVVIPAVLDEEGNEVEPERTEQRLVTEAVEAKDAYTRTDTYETLEEAPEGATERTRLGVRYPELLAFIIASI